MMGALSNQHSHNTVLNDKPNVVLVLICNVDLAQHSKHCKTVSRLSLQIRIICKLNFFVYQRIIMKFCILVVGTEYMNKSEKKC